MAELKTPPPAPIWASTNIHHVAVNARLLQPGKLEGIGRFTQEVLRVWAQRRPHVRFSLLAGHKLDPAFLSAPNMEAVYLPPPPRHPLLYLAWFQGSVRLWLAAKRPDVFFSPDGYLSLGSQTPQVGVLHDLAHRRFPQAVDAAHRWFYARYIPRYAKAVQALCTVSDFSRQDLATAYGLNADAIRVVYNGADQVFHRLPAAQRAAQKARWAEGKPYFLYAGAIQPRKNLNRLFQAFDRFKTETGSDTQLVLTGRKAWNFDQILSAYAAMQHRESVHFTGFVSDSELNALYNGARALCYVSLFEGFGLPILEALQAETPVIASQTSSMPEVGGAAAYYVDPQSIEHMAKALADLDQNERLREHLLLAGRAQRGHFSWEKTAFACWEALEAARRRR